MDILNIMPQIQDLASKDGLSTAKLNAKGADSSVSDEFMKMLSQMESGATDVLNKVGESLGLEGLKNLDLSKLEKLIRKNPEILDKNPKLLSIRPELKQLLLNSKHVNSEELVDSTPLIEKLQSNDEKIAVEATQNNTKNILNIEQSEKPVNIKDLRKNLDEATLANKDIQSFEGVEKKASKKNVSKAANIFSKESNKLNSSFVKNPNEINSIIETSNKESVHKVIGPKLNSKKIQNKLMSEDPSKSIDIVDGENILTFKKRHPLLQNKKASNVYKSSFGQTKTNLIDRDNILNSKMDEISKLNTTASLTPVSFEQESIASFEMINGKVTNEFSSNQKVLDLGNIKATSPDQLIEKISEYIKTQSNENLDKLDLTVKHRDLGQFKLNVTKEKGMSNIDMQIETGTKLAQNFFTQHEGALLSKLNSAGIKIGSLKVVVGSSNIDTLMGSNDKSGSEGSFDSQMNQGNKGQRGSEWGQRQQESQKRKDLWNQYKERMGA